MLEEVVIQENVQDAAVQPSTAQVASEGKQVQETAAQINWRQMRQEKEAAERRAQDYERKLQDIQRSLQPQQQEQQEPDEDLGIDDDALSEGKHLKKIYKKLNNENKAFRAQLEQFNNYQAEMKLRAKFTDFDSVVTEDNIKKLMATKGSMARSIMANPDLYDKGETAYEAIKTWVTSEDYTAQEKKLEENKNKPKSSSSIAPQTAETPLAKIGDYDRRVLTEERKNQLRQQVEEAKRNR